MLVRISSFLIGGLLFGLLAPAASAQAAQAPVIEPESICPKALSTELPRLIGQLKSTDAQVRDKAIVTLGSLGKRALPAAPALIEIAVNTRGHALALQALVKIDDESTRKALRPLLVGGRGRCKCGKGFDDVLVGVGPAIVPHLISMLPEKDLTGNIESVLIQMGEPAVPAMTRAFDDKVEATRLSLYRSLTRMGVKGKSAVAALEQRLMVEQGTVRVRAAEALYAVAGSHAMAFTVLHDALQGNDKALRTESLYCLTEIQVKSKALIPVALKIVLEDETQDFGYAMQILTTIRADAVPALMDALAKDNVKHRDRLMTTLRYIGPEARAAVPMFISILDGSDRKLASLAADSLPELGPEAKAAIPNLLAALKADDRNLQIAAAQSLVRIDRDQGVHTVAPMVEIMRTTKGVDWWRAYSHVSNLGAQAKSAVPALLEMLKTSDLQTRVSIAGAVQRIDTTQIEPAIPSLIEAIQGTQNTPTRRSAVTLLGQIGPRAKAAVPALQTLLKQALSGKGMNSYTVVDSMKRIGAQAEIMEVVIEGLNSKEQNAREDARYLIEDDMGATALPALDAALANGRLFGTPEVIALMTQLRKQAGK